MMFASLLSTAVLSALLTSLANAQSSMSSGNGYHTYTLPPPMPANGVQPYANDLQSIMPLVCELGCTNPINNYLTCYAQDILPNGAPVNQTACTLDLCSQEYFDQLSACLNCIIANGNDRPPGYYTNSSITAYPPQTTTTQPPGDGGYKELKEPLVDMGLANQMLGNITGRCQSASMTVTGLSTVTATPTTTGPYYTSWTSGQVLNVTQWTGLTQFTSGLNLVTATQVVTVDASGFIIGGLGGSGSAGGSGSVPAASATMSGGAGSSMTAASGAMGSATASASAGTSAGGSSGGMRAYVAGPIFCLCIGVMGSLVVLI